VASVLNFSKSSLHISGLSLSMLALNPLRATLLSVPGPVMFSTEKEVGLVKAGVC
jgi:hypothetical protein